MSALNVVDENDVNRLEEWRHTENCCRTSLTFTLDCRMLSKVVKLLKKPVGSSFLKTAKNIAFIEKLLDFACWLPNDK